MLKNDFEFKEYDLSIMKNNITRLMQDSNITQSTLADAIGMQQSAISKVLNINNSSSFTISQLVNIANYFSVSVDQLLGIEPQKKHTDIVTLSDICKKLFELDELLELKFGGCFTGRYREEPYSKEGDMIQLAKETEGGTAYIVAPALYFDNEILDKILLEWRNIKKLNLPAETKNRLLQLWEADILSTTHERYKEFDFMTPEEWDEIED